MLSSHLVGKETLKVEEVTAIILDDENFNKTGSSNEGGAFVTNSSCGRNNLLGNN